MTKLSALAADLKRQYQREYRKRVEKRSPGKKAEYNRRYWEKKAAELEQKILENTPKAAEFVHE